MAAQGFEQDQIEAMKAQATSQQLHKIKRSKSTATWHGTAFVLEAVILLLFIAVSLAIICSVCSKSFLIDRQANHTTQAMVLATTGSINGAETFSADPDEDVPSMVYYVFTDEGAFEQISDYKPGCYVVNRTVQSEQLDGGTIYRALITVSEYNETIYSLTTASYVSDGRR